MITIRNIQKIGGEMCLGRKIWDVTKDENKLGEQFYCFQFGHEGNGLEWNKPVEVRLNREAREGMHYLFVMGLEGVTGIHITQENIRNKEALLDRITRVLSKAKYWWENERG